MKVIIEPFPANDLFDAEAWGAICKRKEEPASGNGHSKHHRARDPGCHQTLAGKPFASSNVSLRLLSALLAVVNRLYAKNELNESPSYQAGC